MNPFDRVRARFLIPWLLLAGCLGVVPVLVIWPEWPAVGPDSPMPDAVAMLVVCFLLFAVPALRASRAGLVMKDLYGDLPPCPQLIRLAILALPMVGAGLIGIYILYAPLSLVSPAVVEAWLFEAAPVLYTAASPCSWVANLIGLLAFVFVVPLTEEWFFRGLLLRRWCHKWGPVKAVVASSLVFALLHVEILGAFVFGVFMCALTAYHRSLWAPTIVHMTNNGIVWCIMVFDAYYTATPEAVTAAELRAAWWLPVVGLLLFAPWALRFRARYGPVSSWSFGTPRGQAL